MQLGTFLAILPLQGIDDIVVLYTLSNQNVAMNHFKNKNSLKLSPQNHII